MKKGKHHLAIKLKKEISPSREIFYSSDDTYLDNGEFKKVTSPIHLVKEYNRFAKLAYIDPELIESENDYEIGTVFVPDEKPNTSDINNSFERLKK
jgi:hypothetical protein